MKTEVYRNPHKNCFSVRQNGRVVGHLMRRLWKRIVSWFTEWEPDK